MGRMIPVICLLVLASACSDDKMLIENSPVYRLTVYADPPEAGTISPFEGEFEEGEEVEISAVSNDPWLFESWQGDLTGDSNPATVTITRDLEISALFRLREYPLSIQVEGEGSVSEEVISPKATDYPHGTVVKLSASPAMGWRFIRWEGDAAGSENPIEIEVEEPKEILAVFSRAFYELSVDVSGGGNTETEVISGEWTEDGLEYESEVRIAADPDQGWHFSAWTGDVNNTENPLTLSMTDNFHITGEFNRNEYGLSIQTEGDGSVSQQLKNGTKTESGYLYESEVELEAEPAAGWYFSDWQGDLDGDDNPETITIRRDWSVTAVFKPLTFTLDIDEEGRGRVTEELISGDKIGNRYTFGAVVELQARPNRNWRFVRWSGDLNGSENPLRITIEKDIEAEAHFSRRRRGND